MSGFGTKGQPLGLAGATAATRYAGGTASGAPVAGTFKKGDMVPDQAGTIWLCTVAGTPGTWVAAGASGGTIAPSVLIIPGAASPAQTAEGSAVWDTDDDLLTIGTGAGRKTFYAPSDVVLTGTFAARPAAGIAGRLYYTTDLPVVYRDTGAAWVALSWGGSVAGIVADVTDNADSGSQGANSVDVVTFTIPAGFISAGTMFRILFAGVVNPTSGAAPTFKLQARVGAATTVCSTTNQPTNSLVADRAWWAEARYTFRTVNAVTGTLQVDLVSTFVAGTNLANTSSAADGQVTNLDTTGAVIIKASTAWGAATTGNVGTTRVAAIELVHP